MSRHRRARTGPFVRRSAYLDLWHRYEALLADYRALEADNALLIGDAEEAATAVEAAGTAPGRYVTPSWAETEPIPVITTAGAGLDPDKATALVHRGGLLVSPSGEWSEAHPGTSG